MRVAFYNCLFGDVDLPEPNDKIIYSYLVYKSLAAIDEIFSSEDGSFDNYILEKHFEEESDSGYYGFSYSKVAKDLNMSLNTVKSRVDFLIKQGFVEIEGKEIGVYIKDSIKSSFYFDLQLSKELKGESLIVYSYLKHKSKNNKSIITTYDKTQAEEFCISKKNYQKILCGLYKLKLAERLPNGRLLIN